ncbi:sugar phosphate nucleotidyltransferase [Blattabacterium cuenoti]|uniref:sugar phosphate nucleotidyltransferase n=1 Tax=Blattabacterium cuenoti TaxID=1653831 RepID=UPI00163B8DC5|nr:sugar phosphate nucleotidyltransferase [Blattabacterium cuenoti]
MKIIIPIAGRGIRLYPHTLCTPKTFLNIAGKSILKRLLDELLEIINFFSIKEIIFIVNLNTDKIKVEKKLRKLTDDIGINSIIYFQKEPLGTADAILKAKKSLIGDPVIIVFSDALFHKIDFKENINQILNNKNIIWTNQIKNPTTFGVVKCNSSGRIINFIEKPNNFISDLAIVGIYYFHNSLILKEELQYVINNNIKNNKEYQLTTVLENMRKKGEIFISQLVKNWIDFGNIKTIISSISKILSIDCKKKLKLIHKNSLLKNSIIIEPSYIGESTIIENSIIGPYVSIGKFSYIKNSNIKKSLIQNYANVVSSNLENSIIGNYTSYKEKAKKINLGDYSTIKNNS